MGSLKKNVIYQTAYQILTIILPFVTSPYVSRVLGAENLGIYSYTYSIASYFVLFAMLGIANYGNRSIAMVRDDQNKLNRTFSGIFVVHSAVSLIVILFYVVYLVILVRENQIIAVIQTVYIIAALLDINWFYFGIEQFKITVTRNTIVKLLTVVSIFLFIRSKDDLWIYVTIMAFGSFLSQSLVWLFLRKYVSFVKPTFAEMKKHIKPMLVLFIPVLAISLYKVMDKIMLGNMCAKAQVGFYENSEKAINIPNSVIGAFGTVMLPKMSNLLNTGKEKEGRKYMNLSMKYIMIVSFALAFGLAAVSDIFSVVFWGEEFRPSGILIAILAMTVPFLAFANVIRTQHLIPMCKDKEYTISVFVGAGVNLLFNIILIPQYQAVGAALGTLFAEVSVCVIQAFFVRKDLPLAMYLKNCVFFILAGVVMYTAVYALNLIMSESVLSLALEIAAGGVVFVALSAVYLWVTKDDFFRKTVKKYLRRSYN